MDVVKRYFGYALVGVSIFNILLLGSYFLLTHELRKGAIGSSIRPVSGVLLNGEPWSSAPAKCHIVRFTEDKCPYCEKDAISYGQFLDAARRNECEILELAPRAGELQPYTRRGVRQLKYVTQDLGPVLFPLVTPQTVILDESWTVLWMRRGIFGDRSLSEAIAVLDSIHGQ
jgi:hypothetical protein